MSICCEVTNAEMTHFGLYRLLVNIMITKEDKKVSD